MIKIKDYDKKKEKLIFTADMSLSLANAIRRSVLEIPIMAIDEVEIVKNDSALYDEIISHRLGLIPIKTDKTSKEMKFKLKGTGPKIVYSTDLQPSVETEYKIPIVILDEEQELEIVCDARLGKGIEHIKYSPGLLYYKHNLDSDIIDFVQVDDEGKVTFNQEELDNLSLSDNIKKKINQTKEVKELEFTIESWKQMSAKDIFLRAMDVLEENLDDLEKAVK